MDLGVDALAVAVGLSVWTSALPAFAHKAYRTSVGAFSTMCRVGLRIDASPQTDRLCRYGTFGQTLALAAKGSVVTEVSTGSTM